MAFSFVTLDLVDLYELLLEHVDYARWSDRAIAEAARVHHSFVGRLRRELDGGTGAGASADGVVQAEQVRPHR